jgi:hypothetical protein
VAIVTVFFGISVLWSWRAAGAPAMMVAALVTYLVKIALASGPSLNGTTRSPPRPRLHASAAVWSERHAVVTTMKLKDAIRRAGTPGR